MAKPSTSKLIREALAGGPKCVWEVYKYVKNAPTHYKRRVTYRSIYNMLYVLRALGLVRRMSRQEAERLGLRPRGNGRINPRYARTYYELADVESKAWENPYKAYSSTL